VEPVTMIVMSLALGAAAEAGKATVGEAVKDAYAALKRLMKTRFPSVSVDLLEQAPESKNRQLVVAEDLETHGAQNDSEVLAAVQVLMKAVEQSEPQLAASIGVDLKDIEAANLRLTNIVASGTGVSVKKANLSGDLEIRDVRAGVGDDGRKKS
jgi:hypothetical protein